MPKSDPRVDKYINQAEEFAQPVLHHIRALVHAACPEVEETIKWGTPHFDYKGMMCRMASFKQHCSFGFWKASLMTDPEKLLSLTERHEMGNFEKITSLQDLPPDETVRAYIREACKLNDEGVRSPAKPKKTAPELVVPGDLLEELARHEAAALTFASFSYSAKKEYVEWIIGAKTEATRTRRLLTTIEWLAEGKRRNWKYENC